MAKDEDDRLLIQLEKRVLNNEIAEATAMLQVFAGKRIFAIGPGSPPATMASRTHES